MSESTGYTKQSLKALLEQAKSEARRNKREQEESGSSNPWKEDEILLTSEKEKEEERELPELEVGSGITEYFELAPSKGGPSKLVHDERVKKAESSASSHNIPAPPAPPQNLFKDGKRLTKKEMKETKKATAGKDWFDLPAPNPADLPKLYREVEAMRLRNALDPKRFYRKDEGEAKGIKGLPKYFAMGTVVSTSTPFGTSTADNLTRAERKRNIVDELVDDAEARHRAKRKFEDLQTVRGANGRGTLAKKLAKRKPKW